MELLMIFKGGIGSNEVTILIGCNGIGAGCVKTSGILM